MKKYVLMEVHEKGLYHGKIHHYVPWNAKPSERLSLNPSTIIDEPELERRLTEIIGYPRDRLRTRLARAKRILLAGQKKENEWRVGNSRD